MLFILALTIVVLAVVIYPHIGRPPRGKTRKRMAASPYFLKGKFRNFIHTPIVTEDKNRIGLLFKHTFERKPRLRPSRPIPAVKTDLKKLDPREDVLVWFGHSSYFIQTDGKRILVDPVFSEYLSPVPGFLKAFEGTDLYHAEDMPPIDYLFITHDHWDHLDYEAVRDLQEKTGAVICGLGTGEHFRFWDYPEEKIIEKEWGETFEPDRGFRVHAVPARHFSGRFLRNNQALWTSYLLETPSRRIFLGGDGGYGPHFASVGEQFGEIDLALLENGQYNADWKYIHLMPEETVLAAQDLRTRCLMPIHSGKFALASHPWDEPLKRVSHAASEAGMPLLTPMIGQRVDLADPLRSSSEWWIEID